MPHQEVIIIAALAESNRVIGRDLDLPWHLPEDLKRFKRLTLGHVLVMGRRTYLSIIHQFGKPLPNRRHVVLSSRGAVDGLEGVETYPSVSSVLEALKDVSTIYIGGGGKVYEQFLPLATRLELTLVEGEYTGDTFFPAYQHLVGSAFELSREEYGKNFRFETYDRTLS